MPPDAKTRDEIVAQATDWLVQLDAGAADRAAFEEWRNSDTRHASIFAQVAAGWQKLGELRFVPPRDETALPAEVSAEEPGPPLQEKGGMHRRAAIGSLVAGVAALAAGTAFWLHDRRHFADTGVGERRTVQLPGGNRAELNTDTRIAWHMADVLEVWLERGEAAIIVASSLASAAADSLILRAGSLQAVLDRGSYNLRLREQGPSLTVLSGRAEVRDEGIATTLTANQVLHDSQSGFATAELSTAERQSAEAWQRGEIIFDGMRLSEALSEFNRYLPQPILVADPEIGSIRLGGRFRTDDPQGFLLSIQEAFGIGNRAENGSILLFSKNDIS